MIKMDIKSFRWIANLDELEIININRKSFRWIGYHLMDRKPFRGIGHHLEGEQTI